MKKIKLAVSAAMFICILSTGVFACDMSKMDNMPDDCNMKSMRHEDTQKSVFNDATMKMHKAMAETKPTGDVDTDFVIGMILHHQGAIDMAKIELSKGKDAKIQKMAKDIIKAQEGEIAMMHQWLKVNKAK